MQSLRWNKRDNRDAMKMQNLFIPFTINRPFWNREMPNVFLNQVYEAQVEEAGYPYTTLITAYSDNGQIHEFWLDWAHALGNILNQPCPNAFMLMYVCEKKMDEWHTGSISRKIQSLLSLTTEVRLKCLVRDYPVGYEWHVPKKIQTFFKSKEVDGKRVLRVF